MGSAIVGIFILWPMMKGLQDLDYQERLMARDIKSINGLINKSENSHLYPQLIDRKNVPLVVNEIMALGNAHSINFLSVISQDKSKSLNKKFNTHTIDLETQSTYEQLGLFCYGLNGLHSGIVVIESFQMIADKQNPDSIKTKIQLQIYLKKEASGKK